MAVEYVRVRTRGQGLQLEPEVEGMTITVPAGSFEIGSQQYTLDEKAVFTATPDDEHHLVVRGCLALQDDALVVVVDEYLRGVEQAYRFRASSDFDLLHVLYQVVIPPGAQDLDDVTIRVVHLEPEE